MPSLLAVLLWLVALTPPQVPAQTNAAKSGRSPQRWLFIVETSRPMQRRADAVLGTVQEMLTSGMAGQLRPGDTLGVWTFNADLYAGRSPLQTWSPEAQPDIASRTLTFLKAQKYEKQANFDKVMPALNGVISDSRLLTVVLISSGDEKMHGTPFDVQINEFYQKWHDDQQKARMPFVIVMRAKAGQLADYALNTPPFPTQMPRLSQPTQRAETLHEKLAEALHNPPPPAVPPLILSGKKPQPQQAPAPQPAPAQVKVEAPAPVPRAISTNQSLTVKPAVAAAPPAQIVKAEVAPVMPIKPSVDLSPKPSPAPAPVAAAKVEVIAKPETKLVAFAPAASQVASVLPPPAPVPKPATLEPPKTSPAPESKPAPVPVPVTEPKVQAFKAPEIRPVVPAPPKVEAVPALLAPAPKPVPAPPAAREVAPQTSASANLAASAPPRSLTLDPRPSTLPVPPPQAATAVPAETLARSRTIWTAGLVLAGVAIGSALLLFRRSRTAPAASLITQSFERKNKR